MSARRAKPPIQTEEIKSHQRKLLLKKCFRSWRQVAFGRVSPARAREHHRKKLLGVCIRTWKNTHLPSRVEWKLMIRAEYHERFRLWQLCLNGWKQYVVIRREEKMLEGKADQLYHRNLCRNVLVAFKQNKEMQTVKKRMKQQAREFHEQQLQKLLWRRWMFAFNNSHMQKNMDFTALKHWAHNIVRRTFFTWHDTYMDRCDVRKRLMYAEMFYTTKLVNKMIAAWVLYVGVRRERAEERRLAEETRGGHLVRGCFTQWRTAWHHQLLVRESEKVIEDHGELAIKRRYFSHLRAYWQFKCHMRHLMQEASLIHEKKLKRSALRRLAVAVAMGKLKRKRTEEAVVYHNNGLLLRYFMQWTARCDHAEDIKMIPLTRIAYRYRRLKVANSVMSAWKLFVKEQRRKHILTQIATQQHNARIVPACFAAWKLFVGVQREICEMKESAEHFHQDLVHSKYFYTWLKELKLKEVDVLHEDVAVLHCNGTRLNCCFALWKKRARDCSAERTMQETADQHALIKCCTRVLSTWKQRYKDVHTERINSNRAENHYKRKLCEKCLRGFLSYHARRKTKELKIARADSFYSEKICREVLQSWSEYVAQRRELHKQVAAMCEKKNTIVKTWVLETWREFVVEEKQMRKSFGVAEEHFAFLLLRRSFLVLKGYAAKRVEKRYFEDEAVIRAGIKLEQSYMRSVFVKWREAAVELCESKDKMALAKQHRDCVAMKKAVSAWKSYVCIQVRMKIFRSRAVLFHTISVERRCFSVWIESHRDARDEVRKSNMALLWWSYHLQRKVLAAMKTYAAYQREKKAEYAAALTFRRNRLMEEGVVSWLQFASHSMSRRRDIAYREQVRKTTELQARVHRYALRWLQKTRRGKRIPEEQRRRGDLCRVSEVVVTTTVPTVTSPDKRCKKFSTPFPNIRSRPPPRLPDYLRESFELSALRKDSAPVGGSCNDRNYDMKNDNISRGRSKYELNFRDNINNKSDNNKENISDNNKKVNDSYNNQFRFNNHTVNIEDINMSTNECANTSNVSNNNTSCSSVSEERPRVVPSVPKLHSPVVHPFMRSCSDSMRFLELTDDMDSSSGCGCGGESKSFTGGERGEVLLLPPSKFTKSVHVD